MQHYLNQLVYFIFLFLLLQQSVFQSVTSSFVGAGGAGGVAGAAASFFVCQFGQ